MGRMTEYKKVQPKVRDAPRDRAYMGHVAVQVTMDVRPVEVKPLLEDELIL